jgi:predicted amidohydrolase YtcJ
MHLTTPYTNEEMDEQIANRARYASEMVAPNFVKIFLDGTPDGYAVPLVEPYSDGSGEYGQGKMSPDELRDIVVAFDAEGIGVFMHSIGDSSARMALDAIEAAREANGNTGVRHKIAHLALVHPDDMSRFATIPDVAAEISPAAPYPTPAIPYVGEERYQRLYPARSLINAGARLGYGTDWLTIIPPSPWMPFQGFVTRVNPEMPEKGELGENETLSIEQTIRVFTINGAYAVSAEERIGSIEEGKLADMIVLDRNLFEIEPTDIRNTQVLKTVLNGILVYDRVRDEEIDNIDEEDYEKTGRIVH